MPTPETDNQNKILIREMGPRDGLQSQGLVLEPATRLEFIRRLAVSGLNYIESGAYVSPKWVPAMAGTDEINRALKQENPGYMYASLVPNQKGLELAMADEVPEIAVFTAASDGFTKKNINKTVEESLLVYREIVRQASSAGIRTRAYVSTITHCPYEGRVDPEKVRRVCEQVLEMGVNEISLGETLGRAVPGDIDRVLSDLLKDIPAGKLAGHFHDTFGQALANTVRAMEMGVRIFDSSAGGIGGCPYAPGAAGNLATEDLVYYCRGMGWETGVDIEKLCQATDYIAGKLPAGSVGGRAWRAIIAGKSDG